MAKSNSVVVNAVPMSALQAMRAELALYAPIAAPAAPTGFSASEHVAMFIGSVPSTALHFTDCIAASYKLSEARRKAAQ